MRIGTSWLALVAASVLLVSGCGGAVESPTAPLEDDERPVGDEKKPLTRQERADEFRRISPKVHKKFGEKDYAGAAELCRKMIELAPDQAVPYYNLACALAKQGKSEDAIAALAKSIELGYNDAGHMKRDDDLASIREDKRFAALVEKAGKAVPGGKGRYEPGEDIAGVKTVERSPEGGLRYRIRMSPGATVEKPNRLIVWLHPSGGSANRAVERIAPRFIKQGFALLVLTQKQFKAWRGDEMASLLKVTLPDAHKIPGIDARWPVLMGYSAGGQMALNVWPKNAGKFGGMIIDAAYPLVRGAGGYSFMPVPEGEGVRKCPIFVLVGGNDGGAASWKRAEDVWVKAGVPLKVTYVPGKGHAWLFGPKQLDDLDVWLGEVAAGKLPGKAKAAEGAVK